METLSELKTNKDRRISQLGKNLTKYSTKNLDVYKKAAEKGDAEAQYNLGLLYDNGLG
jgi:TPR repeat protein